MSVVYWRRAYWKRASWNTATWSTVLPTALLFMIVTAATANAQDTDEDLLPQSGLTADELNAEPPDTDANADETQPVESVPAADATNVTIAPLVERGYLDEQGRYVIDLVEEDYAYVGIRVETGEGQPVEGAAPTFSIEGTSQLFTPEDLAKSPTSGQDGIVEFAIVAGQMGLDRVAVNYADASIEVLFNVISFRTNSFSLPELGEDFLSWDDLLQADVRLEDVTFYADFPEAVTARSGETVKMAGFMVPLKAGITQEWFLLTSHPPGCYFHVPGGPAGAVEVFAEEGIEVAWGPVVLEGRFKALTTSESAVYQLSDAKLIKQ
ncbi:MAG: DUF3299 domain-containing protein [Pseudomonadota bacterium]